MVYDFLKAAKVVFIVNGLVSTIAKETRCSYLAHKKDGKE